MSGWSAGLQRSRWSRSIGIRDGHIVVLGCELGTAREVIDAAGNLVLPVA